MKVQLPRNISIIKSAELEDYFAFYAFSHPDHLFLYITDKSFNLVEEIEINEKGYSFSSFHLTNKNELIFSVAISSTSERLTDTKSYYQYYETKWYKLKILSKGFLTKEPVIELDTLEYWKRSEISKIVSKTIGGRNYWLSNIQNIRIEDGRYKKSWSLQYATTSVFNDLPRFKRIDIEYSAIKAIDFHVEEEVMYVAGICGRSRNIPIILTYNMQTKKIHIEELEMDIRELHHLHDVKLVNRGDEIVSYFNSTSHEYSKIYEFRIFRTITPKSRTEKSKVSHLNDLDFIQNVKWYEHDNRLFASYVPSRGYKRIRISEVLADEEILIDELEGISTIMITRSNELIYSYVMGNPSKKTYLEKRKMKTKAHR